MIDEFNRTGPITVEPRVSIHNGLFCSMYPGDSGYESTDSTKDAVLHRLMGNLRLGQYEFHHSDDCPEPSITGGIMF